MMTRYKKFTVIDNFISKNYQEKILDGLGHYSTPWLYQEDMDYGFPDGSIDTENTYQKYSQFVIKIMGGDTKPGPFFYALMGLTSKIIDDLMPGYHEHRTRGILHTPMPNPPLHYVPHVDSEDDLWSAIYYPHDATGDTFLFEEQFNDVDMAQRRLHDWKPIDQVTPKQGRLIMFPANQYHAGSPPKTDRRMLINFNFNMDRF